MQESKSLLDPADLIPLRDVLPCVPFSKPSLHAWAKSGRFPAPKFTIAKSWLWSRTEVNAWLAAHDLPLVPAPADKKEA